MSDKSESKSVDDSFESASTSTQSNELSDSNSQHNSTSNPNDPASQSTASNRLNELSKSQLLTLLSRLQTKLKTEQSEHAKTKQLVEKATTQSIDKHVSQPTDQPVNQPISESPTESTNGSDNNSKSVKVDSKPASQSNEHPVNHSAGDETESVLEAQVAALKIKSLETEISRLNQSVDQLNRSVTDSKTEHDTAINQLKTEHELSITKARTVAHKLHEKGKQIQAALTEQQSINRSIKQTLKSFARTFVDLADSMGMKRESQSLTDWLDEESTDQSTSDPVDQSVIDRINQSIKRRESEIKRMKDESVKSMIELSALQEKNNQLNQSINQLNKSAHQSVNSSEHQKLQEEMSSLKSVSQSMETKAADLMQQLDKANHSVSQLVSINQSNWIIQSANDYTDCLIDQVHVASRYHCKQSNNTWLLLTDQPIDRSSSQSIRATETQSVDQSINQSADRRYWWTSQSEFIRRKRVQFDSSINQSIKPFLRPGDDCHLSNQSTDQSMNGEPINQMTETQLIDSFLPLVFFDGVALPIELNHSISQSMEQSVEQRWKQLLVKSQEENQSINQSINQLNGQIEALKLENSRLQQRASAAQRTISQLMDQSINQDDQSVNQSITQLEQEVDRLMRELRDSVAERNALNDRWQQASMRSDEIHDRSINQLNQSIEHMQKQHNQSVSQLNETIQQLKAKLAEQSINQSITPVKIDEQTQTDQSIDGMHGVDQSDDNQSFNQSANQSINQTNNQAFNQSLPSNYLPRLSVQLDSPIYNQPFHQSTNQSINQSINQSTNHYNVPTSAFDSSPHTPSDDQSIQSVNQSINQSISQSTDARVKSLQSLLRASEQRAQAAEQSINQLTLELSTKTVMNDTRNKLMDPASIAYLQHCVTSFLATHDESLEPVICQLLNIDKTQVGQLKKDKTQSNSVFSLFKR